jgi:hypothetical protein
MLLALVLLVGAAATVLVVEARGQQRRRARAAEFQRLVGGLGFGPALDLSDGAYGFDPRLDGDCGDECGPIPGGGYYGRRHAGCLFSYPPVQHGPALAPYHGRVAP